MYVTRGCKNIACVYHSCEQAASCAKLNITLHSHFCPKQLTISPFKFKKEQELGLEVRGQTGGPSRKKISVTASLGMRESCSGER